MLRSASSLHARVAERLPSPVPPEQSLQVMAILDGIYRSQVEGRGVTVDAT